MESIPTPEELTPEQKAGQLLFARGPQLFAAETRQMLEAGLIGGMQVGTANCASDIAQVRQLSRFRLLVGADMEDGEPPGAIPGVHLGTLFQLSRLKSPEAAYEFAAHSARFARAAGIDFNFGPVADLILNARNPMVNIRSLGDDMAQLIELAAALVRGYQDNGMLTSVKHYPGAGRGECDSHIEMISLQCSAGEFQDTELEIYRQLLKKTDLTAVMTGHIAVPALDGDTPASCSVKLTNLLRRIGFRGLLISDSLAMRGLDRTGNLPGRVLAAGHDMILIDYRVPPRRQLDDLLRAIGSDEALEKQVDESVRRVLDFKRRVAAFRPLPPDRQAAEALAETIAEHSVDITVSASGLPEFDPARTLLILAEEREYDLGGSEVRGAHQELLVQFGSYLKRHFPELAECFCSADPFPNEIEAVLNRAAEADRVIVCCTASSGCYKGTADLSRRLLALIGGLRRKTAALVLIGNPQAARELPELPLVMTFPADTPHRLKVPARRLAERLYSAMNSNSYRNNPKTPLRER